MSINNTEQTVILVEGKGDSKQHAFASALNQIQKKMMQESEVILRIEPIKVNVLKASQKNYTERFLFFFFPRKRVSYQVKLEVTVSITTLQIDAVRFDQEMTDDPESIHIPIISKRI